jgi:hypothetical protein
VIFRVVCETGQEQIMKTAQLQMAAFGWRIAKSGYEWKQSVSSRPHLYEQNVPGKGSRISQPLIDTPGLFREFTKLRDKDDIREFADQYGVLFDRYSHTDHIKARGTYWSVGASCGTALTAWQREIADMRTLVAVWDSITSNNMADLKQIVFWRNQAVEYRIVTPKYHASAWLTLPGVPHQFGEGDLLLPAQCALQREINKRLSDESNESDHKIACVPRLVWNPDGSQSLAIVPPNLLGAMWLQFAQFASGAYQLRLCAACNKYFQVGEGVQKRSDAITCSDACRQRKRRESL